MLFLQYSTDLHLITDRENQLNHNELRTQYLILILTTCLNDKHYKNYFWSEYLLYSKDTILLQHTPIWNERNIYYLECWNGYEIFTVPDSKTLHSEAAIYNVPQVWYEIHFMIKSLLGKCRFIKTIFKNKQISFHTFHFAVLLISLFWHPQWTFSRLAWSIRQSELELTV